MAGIFHTQHREYSQYRQDRHLGVPIRQVFMRWRGYHKMDQDISFKDEILKNTYNLNNLI